MRTRQPRQLKPYAFDRLAYKHQLKHHPDAIVKLAGRRSPVESSSRSSEGDADGVAENSGGENPTRSPVHRRTFASFGEQLSLGSPLDRRFMEPYTVSDLALAASIRNIDGGESGDGPVEAGAWYPDAFNDLSSGLGGDDMSLSTAQDNLRGSHTPPPRVKRRRVLFLLFDRCLYADKCIHSESYRVPFHTCRLWLPHPSHRALPLYALDPPHWEPSA